MKRLMIVVILLLGFIQADAIKYNSQYTQQGISDLVGGEHTGVIYRNIFSWGGVNSASDSAYWPSDSTVVCGANGYNLPYILNGARTRIVSPWMQIGYSTAATAAANKAICYFDPEYFNLRIKLIQSVAANTGIALSTVWYQLADDTTWIAYEPGDTTNYFVQDGNYNHNRYNFGMYDSIDSTDVDSMGVDYALYVQSTGYIRFMAEIDNLTDTVFVDAELWCTH